MQRDICVESRQAYQALKSLATHKTDRNDARGLAHLARTGFFKFVPRRRNFARARPGLASIPGAMLLMASSPYAKRGELYNAYRRHFGKDDGRVLVWKASTQEMNPSIDKAVIEEAYESDPESARAPRLTGARDFLPRH